MLRISLIIYLLFTSVNLSALTISEKLTEEIPEARVNPQIERDPLGARGKSLSFKPRGRMWFAWYLYQAGLPNGEYIHAHNAPAPTLYGNLNTVYVVNVHILPNMDGRPDPVGPGKVFLGYSGNRGNFAGSTSIRNAEHSKMNDPFGLSHGI
jgi:hypothetical protein